jgi:hypothetical protein
VSASLDLPALGHPPFGLLAWFPPTRLVEVVRHLGFRLSSFADRRSTGTDAA